RILIPLLAPVGQSLVPTHIERAEGNRPSASKIKNPRIEGGLGSNVGKALPDHEGHFRAIEANALRTAVLELLQICQQPGIRKEGDILLVESLSRKGTKGRLGGPPTCLQCDRIGKALPNRLARPQECLASPSIDDHEVA